MKVTTDFFTSIGEERAPGQIPPESLTVLWPDSSWVYSKRMILNMNQILWVPCTTALTDTSGRQDHVNMTWGDIQRKSTSGGQT